MQAFFKKNYFFLESEKQKVEKTLILIEKMGISSLTLCINTVILVGGDKGMKSL